MDDEPSDEARSKGVMSYHWETGASGDGRTAGIDAARTRDGAKSVRDRLEPEERARVERTVAQLLKLFGKAHTMGSCRRLRSRRSRFAFRT
ncbi:hypothetical protein [Natrinema longum]|uniref:hypothetical protein n=1 Tax=Natrinema longum TaxID=370324 RepID=UPI001CCF6319|nr:hypothetical protein [Natrinema longum]